MGKSKILFFPGVILLLWTGLIVALFSWFVVGEQAHIDEIALRQARAFFSQVVTARQWNSRHGGVYVEVKEGVRPNPYLEGTDRDIVTVDGKTFTKINPAYMTRQLSEIMATSSGVSFHITSLKPKRAANAADNWEKKALLSFKKGEVERFDYLDKGTNRATYRYMAPLYATSSCTQCHSGADAAEGNIRGGISVSIEANPLLLLADANLDRMGLVFLVVGLIGFVGFGYSAVQIIRKRDEAETASRIKSMFLANMSHDMRTPLTGIIGMAELMRMKPKQEEQEEYASLLQLSASNLLEIVNDITDFSRIESGRMELKEKSFSVHELLRQSLDMVRFSCSRKELELESIVGDDVPERLIGDEFRIRQMLGNLLGNSVKFTQKGSVTVRISSQGIENGVCTLRFSVTDTGIGIEPSLLASIFDSFSQGEAALEDGRMGTGLGLSITRQLASMMHGRIWVKSKKGYGSTFTFELPLAVPGRDEQMLEGRAIHNVLDASSDEAPGSVGKTVLAVDDNPLNRVYIQKVLESHGHTVLLAEDGEKALAILEEHCVDVILMDVQMPIMNGIEATRRIRASNELAVPPDVPIIAVTAFTVDGDRERFLQAGMSYYVSKPLQAQAMLDVIEEATKTEEDHVPECSVREEPVELPPTAAEKSTIVEEAGETVVILDIEKAMAAMAGNHTLFTLLCDGFLQESVEKEQVLADSVAAEDWQSAMVAAHAIKNSAGLLAATALQEAATKIETDCRSIVESEGGVIEKTDAHATYVASEEQASSISSAVHALQDVMKLTRDEITAAKKEGDRG